MDLLLIPAFGIAGSAWATLTAQLLSNIYIWVVLKKTNYFSILPRLKRIIGATIVMGIAAVLLAAMEIQVAIGIIISAGIYFGALALLKEPFINEIKLVFKPASTE